AGVADVRRHDEVGARVDGGGEGREVERARLLLGVVDGGEDGVGVLVRVAVAGEVLGRREQAGVVGALDVGPHEGLDGGRLGPEGARRDDGVAGVPVDVGDGGEGDVDAAGEGLDAAHAGEVAHGRLRLLAAAEGAEGHEVREDRRPRDLLPEPALHVGHDEEAAVAPGLEVEERPARLGPAAVEEDEAADGVAVEEVGHGRGVLLGRARGDHVRAEPGHDEAGDLLAEGLGHGEREGEGGERGNGREAQVKRAVPRPVLPVATADAGVRTPTVKRNTRYPYPRTVSATAINIVTSAMIIKAVHSTDPADLLTLCICHLPYRLCRFNAANNVIATMNTPLSIVASR